MGTILKSGYTDENELKLINSFCKRDFAKDEIYTFSIVLCDNDTDRDNERFDESSINKLAKLFVGKTGVFDHQAKAENQSARIYFTEVITDSKRKNCLGQDYTYLLAKAYMVKCDKNKNLILEIYAGIKKEVSISCSVEKVICSICGKEKNSCCHQKGKCYDGNVCHHLLTNPTDAYEWSFVAIPAQKNAGVIKKFDLGGDFVEEKSFVINAINKGEEITFTKSNLSALNSYIKQLEKEADLGQAYKTDLIKEVLSLSTRKNLCFESSCLKAILEKLEIDENKAIKKYFYDDLEKPDVQLLNNNINNFKM